MNNPDPSRRLRVINSVAPIRICDNGGWTDTWFAGHGKVFNIGAKQEITIAALAELVRDLVGSASDIVNVPYQHVFGEGFEDTRRRVPDIRRAAEILGFRAVTSIEDGLEATIAWFQQDWPGDE